MASQPQKIVDHGWGTERSLEIFFCAWLLCQHCPWQETKRHTHSFSNLPSRHFGKHPGCVGVGAQCERFSSFHQSCFEQIFETVLHTRLRCSEPWPCWQSGCHPWKDSARSNQRSLRRWLPSRSKSLERYGRWREKPSRVQGPLTWQSTQPSILSSTSLLADEPISPKHHECHPSRQEVCGETHWQLRWFQRNVAGS